MNNEKELKLKRPLLLTILGIVAIVFGAATIKEGGTVLFTESGKLDAGKFVPFVLWFNFLAGFAYILAGIMLLKLKNCSRRLSSVIAVSTIIIFILFGVHIFKGGEYEVRTLVAMTLRSGLWIMIALVALKTDVLNPADCKC